MRIFKSNDVLKVGATSLLSIGLFSAAFIGSANLVLAASTSKTININPPAKAEAQSEINYPDFEVTVVYDKEAETADSAISAEEAAELGARYIWELFGVDLDGYAIDMHYNEHYEDARWVGWIVESEIKIDSREELFTFQLDADTGERMGASDYRRERDTGAELPEKSISYDDFLQIGDKSPDNLDEYAKLAEEFAVKHFNNTNVVSVLYGGMYITATGRDRSAETFQYNETYIYFIAIDENGENAQITILMETKSVETIDAYTDEEKERDQEERLRRNGLRHE